MKFLVDMPLSVALAVWLQERGHDAVHVSELGMYKATDAEIMARAASEHRCVITADLDFPRLLAAQGTASPSLLLFRGGNWSDADIRNRLIELFENLAETEISKSILVIERDRIRRRWLPIRPD